MIEKWNKFSEKTWVGVAVLILIAAALVAGIMWPGSTHDGTVDQGVRAACTSYVNHRLAVDTAKDRAGLAAAIEREAATGTNTAVIAAARGLGPAAKSADDWAEATDAFAEACFAAGWTPRTS